MTRRVVVYNIKGKVVGLYNDPAQASIALGIDKNNIMFNLRAQGNKFIKGYRFEWEVTNKELREERRLKEKEKREKEIKELEKWFK